MLWYAISVTLAFVVLLIVYVAMDKSHRLRIQALEYSLKREQSSVEQFKKDESRLASDLNHSEHYRGILQNKIDRALKVLSDGG